MSPRIFRSPFSGWNFRKDKFWSEQEIRTGENFLGDKKYAYINRLNTKIRSTMLCLSGFKLYSRWVPLTYSFITRWNTSKFVKNTPLRVVFSTLFSVFHLVMKHCVSCLIERFSCDLEMKTREQNRNNKRTEIERFDWFIERIQTRVGFGWLSERSAEKTSCSRTF